jgi:putative ABC transport system permease protein
MLIRTDLIHSWQTARPGQTPNQIVINILPEQADAFKSQLQQAGISEFDWYPMIRGRLISINGAAVSAEQYADEQTRRLVDREFNLSHSAQPPAHNQIVQGKWQPEQADGLSIEEGIAKKLNIQLGDRLLFDVAGTPIIATVTSVRRVEWTSMRANFFVMYPRSVMPALPHTYISAFRSPAQPGFERGLLQNFPNITNIDLNATLDQIQALLSQVGLAVEFLFFFTLVAGLLVLFAALMISREARARDHAVLRALGATQALLQNMQNAELLGIGALSGLIASVFAMLLAAILGQYVFDFPWTLHWYLPIVGSLAGAVLSWLSGWWSLREALRRPVMQSLRNAAQN